MATPRNFEQVFLKESAYIVTKFQCDGKQGFFLHTDLQYASQHLINYPDQNVATKAIAIALKQRYNLDLPREKWVKLLEAYRGCDVNYDGDKDLTKPNTEPKLAKTTIATQAAAAVQREIVDLSMLHTLKYEVIMPIEEFLKKFELIKNRFMAANLQTTPNIFLLCVSAVVHDPINPPAKGQDGMEFVGPSTWLDEQKPTEVDTYDRLKAKSEVKFVPTIRTSTQIINKIQTIQYSPDKTVEEHITEIDKIVGRTHLEKNPNLIPWPRKDMDIEKSAKMYRKLAVPAPVQKPIETGMSVYVSGSKKTFWRMSHTNLDSSEPRAQDGLPKKCRFFKMPVR
ncbi:hypothetical protein BDD12DRAFT_810714 [Trichophaea hybrida]|nr:hypothetical protein BDD12DRAFT_810714 [Trichophaea hybrida]